MRCQCISSNCPQLGGRAEPLVVRVPDGLYRGGDVVCIDPCIAGAVSVLWTAGISTYSNCCGHNGRFPRHVMVGMRDAARAVRLLDGSGWKSVPVCYADGDKRVDVPARTKSRECSPLTGLQEMSLKDAAKGLRIPSKSAGYLYSAGMAERDGPSGALGQSRVRLTQRGWDYLAAMGVSRVVEGGDDAA